MVQNLPSLGMNRSAFLLMPNGLSLLPNLLSPAGKTLNPIFSDQIPKHRPSASIGASVRRRSTAARSRVVTPDRRI